MVIHFRSVFRFLTVAVFVFASAVVSPAAEPDSAGIGFTGDSVVVDHAGETYVIETRHRLFPDFQQVDTVAFDEPFLIGEEEWEARVILFNPHLGITMEGKGLQMSDTLSNPAVRIRVEHADTLVQESWGFHYVDAPHYRRTDLLGFKLAEFKVGDQYIPLSDKK